MRKLNTTRTTEMNCIMINDIRFFFATIPADDVTALPQQKSKFYVITAAVKNKDSILLATLCQNSCLTSFSLRFAPEKLPRPSPGGRRDTVPKVCAPVWSPSPGEGFPSPYEAEKSGKWHRGRSELVKLLPLPGWQGIPTCMPRWEDSRHKPRRHYSSSCGSRGDLSH
jgi:hypothetical protein